MNVIDKIFDFKGGYNFGIIPVSSLSKELEAEMIDQLADLEKRWIALQDNEQVSFENDLEYQVCISLILLRSEELVRFLDKNAGPRIVQLICSEILEIITMKVKDEKTKLSPLLEEKITIIITALNSHYQMVSMELDVVDPQPIIDRFKEATKDLMLNFAHY